MRYLRFRMTALVMVSFVENRDFYILFFKKLLFNRIPYTQRLCLPINRPVDNHFFFTNMSSIVSKRVCLSIVNRSIGQPGITVVYAYDNISLE